MNDSPLYITRDDHAKLRLLLGAALPSNTSDALEKLRAELDRAIVLDANAIPPAVVTMNSRVTFEDTGSGEVETYTLTFPDHADIDEKRLSILAPVGTALIGFREGDIVDWTTPGGVRHLKIQRVVQPAQDTPPAAPSLSSSVRV